MGHLLNRQRGGGALEAFAASRTESLREMLSASVHLQRVDMFVIHASTRSLYIPYH